MMTKIEPKISNVQAQRTHDKLSYSWWLRGRAQEQTKITSELSTDDVYSSYFRKQE